MELVSNAPLRDAFWRSGHTIYSLSALAKMDDTTVRRSLGLVPLRDKRRRAVLYYNKRMTYETAVKLCRALGVDPVDVGV